MILIDASWPSNKLAAVTTRILWRVRYPLWSAVTFLATACAMVFSYGILDSPVILDYVYVNVNPDRVFPFAGVRNRDSIA